MELDERIEALEKELASIRGNLRSTLEQIKDSLSQRPRSVSGPFTPEGQVQTEDVARKSTSPKAASKRPKGAQKPGTEHPSVLEGSAPKPDVGHEHVASTPLHANAESPSPTADLPSYLDRKLVDLPPDEMESILDMYVSMGYLPGHTRRLMARILHPTESRKDRSRVSLWDCITALAVNDDSAME